MGSRWWATVAMAMVVVVGLLAAVPARAQSEKDGGAEYKRLTQQAIAEFSAGHWAEAHALFERAHAISPNARTLRGLGITEFEMRHYTQALSNLRAALEDTRNPLTDVQRAEVKSVIERSQPFVGTVQIVVEPPHAVLHLNGEPLQERKVTLDVGDYQLAAQADGYKDSTTRLVVSGGEERTLNVRLSRVELAVQDETRSGPRGATSTPEPKDDSGSVFEQWWFWTAAGVIVAGGVVGTVLLLEGGEEREPEEGVGGVIRTLTVRP